MENTEGPCPVAVLGFSLDTEADSLKTTGGGGGNALGGLGFSLKIKLTKQLRSNSDFSQKSKVLQLNSIKSELSDP